MSTIYHRLLAAARREPARPLLRHHRPDGSYLTTTAGELAARATSFAALFARESSRGCIVPIFAMRCEESVAAFLGAVGAGAVPAWVNPKWRAPQVEQIIRAGSTRVGVLDGPGVAALATPSAPTPAVDGVRWQLVRGPAFLPLHETALASLRARAAVAEAPGPDATASGTDARVEPGSAGTCLFTSGSTGTPKGVLISNRDLLDRADAEIDWFELDAADVLLGILPFSFDVGLNQLLTALTTGCSLVILDSWMPADIVRVAAECGVTGISGVPSIWREFLRGGLAFDRSGPHGSLRYVTVSGGDLSLPELRRLPALGQGLGIYKTYGQTEAFRASSLHPREFVDRMTSVGRAFGSARIYVVRDDGSCASPNEIGEVIHTGLGVMLGYLGNDDPGHKLRPNPFRGPDDPAANAVFTGDIGYLDEQGYLYLRGRRDHMLKIAGNRVYPREVAAAMFDLGAVVEAEVLGATGPDGDLRLLACVVPTPGNPIDPMALRRRLAGALPSYMVPAEIRVVDAIPKTASGKPDLPALRRWVETQLAHAPSPPPRAPG